MPPKRPGEAEALDRAALEQIPGQRALTLEKTDQERREVESLLGQPHDRGTLPRILSAGTLLGPYRITAEIGAGGMGHVYRAHDTRLGRDVALKLSRERFDDRFQREARAIAALNHSNICHLYDVGPDFLVMELVEGETLAFCQERDPLPLDRVLKIARQIAEALESAHEKGIVHRDLKPDNVKITPDGMVKVLDFGLAKAVEESLSDTEKSATRTMAVTHAGVILGTAAYMSPEQATGCSVDRRTDIWSFGVVLWEMLTGRRLFRGETVPGTLSAVLSAEIDFSLLPASTPAPIRDLTKRCLDRNLKSRLQAIGEARIALETYLSNPAREEASNSVQAPMPRRSGLRRVAFGATLVLVTVVALVLGVLDWRALRPAPLRPLVRLNSEVAGDTVLARVGGNSPLALSPDGTRLAFTWRAADGKVRLGTRLLRQNAVFPLNNTEGATAPFFSPDGQWIGFFADGRLKKVSVDGAVLTTICAVRDPRGASWGDDGSIVLSAGLGEPLSRVSSSGGTLEPLTRFKGREHTHRWPQFLPGSKYILFTASDAVGNYDDAEVEVLSVKTGEWRTLEHSGFSGRYVSTGSQAGGHLIYLHQNTLFAAPFDRKRAATTGPPVPILEDVGSSPIAGGDFVFADSGLFVYSPVRTATGGPITWLDKTGKRQPLQASAGRYSTPRISPDGKRLAFAMAATAEVDIWVKELEHNTLSRLTFLGGESRYPVWTPDGHSIVFLAHNPQNPGIYWVRSDGSGEARRLTDGTFEDVPFSFTPDGKRIAFHRFAGHGSQIWTAAVEGDPAQPRLGKPELFLDSPFVDLEPAFSPDGHWLAYASNESGTPEVYVRPFPGPGGKWQISTGSGHFPVWSRSGHELFFEKLGEVGIMAVGYTTSQSPRGETFSAGTPRMWSAVPLVDSNNYPNYDLAPDGKRIAALLAPEEAASQNPLTHVTFLLNFFDELRRKAPGGN